SGCRSGVGSRSFWLQVEFFHHRRGGNRSRRSGRLLSGPGTLEQPPQTVARLLVEVDVRHAPLLLGTEELDEKINGAGHARGIAGPRGRCNRSLPGNPIRKNFGGNSLKTTYCRPGQ